MPQQLATAVENNFTKGLVTEATGLNFPENAATDADNIEFTLIGDVERRLGIDLEDNYLASVQDVSGVATNMYLWKNAGGDGVTQYTVTQYGRFLNFWKTSQSNTVSRNYTALVDVSLYVAVGGTFDATKCCEFADGNGYLFVFHPSCDPIYVDGSFVATGIPVSIRDFTGVPDGLADNTRPSTGTNQHNYNLANQGWTLGNPWYATSSSSVASGTGAKVFTVAAGITGISPGQTVAAGALVLGGVTMNGTVTSYAGTTLTLSITSVSGSPGTYSSWSITPITIGYVTTFLSTMGVYPSNADQWWRFKNASGVFDPATTAANISLGAGPAPKGHIILNAFTQYRGSAVGDAVLANVTTTKRPTNGCWFQSRIWYTGVNAVAAATGTSPYTSWTNTIYFSQVVFKPDDFAKCYQTNDPTSQELFDLLPTDGGTIVIQDSGPIYRLFPIQNGLLVFAGNGVWFITGSQGIGFTANDYTVTKISSIQSISSSSFVDVTGLPFFWNEEGIYQVKANQTGSLTVESATVGTIASFYDEIPLETKKLARGIYHPIDYNIQWLYKSANGSGTTDTFNFDRILNFNTFNKAFYPYSIDTSSVSIKALSYIPGIGGINDNPPAIKFFINYNDGAQYVTTFADIHSDTYTDWPSVSATDYTSYFVTGYKVRGQAVKKFQPQYIQVWSRLGEQAGGYSIQGIWDYAASANSGKYSSLENADLPTNVQFGSFHRRHKIRGRGYALQFKVISRDDKPFDIIGWAVVDTINQGT